MHKITLNSTSRRVWRWRQRLALHRMPETIGNAHELEWRGDASIIAKCQCQPSNFTIALRESCRQPSQLWVSATTISFNALSWFSYSVLAYLTTVRSSHFQAGRTWNAFLQQQQKYTPASIHTYREYQICNDVCNANAIMQLYIYDYENRLSLLYRKWFAGYILQNRLDIYTYYIALLIGYIFWK